jgi:hypothetical protein
MPANQISVNAIVGPRTPNKEKATADTGSQPIAALQNVRVLNR